VAETTASGRWACTTCSYAYDPQRGDPAHGIPAGTPFEQVPAAWRCPWCGALKETFVPEDEMMQDLLETKP